VAPRGDGVARRRRRGEGGESIGETGPLGSDQRARVDPEPAGHDELEQQGTPHVPQVGHRLPQPPGQPVPPLRPGAVDDPGRAAVAGLGVAGLDEPERVEPVERPVDEGPGHPPHGAELARRRQHGGDVVAVARPFGQACQHRPLAERQ